MSVTFSVSGSMTVSDAPFMLLTYSLEKSQSGEMCSGAALAGKRPTTEGLRIDDGDVVRPLVRHVHPRRQIRHARIEHALAGPA